MTKEVGGETVRVRQWAAILRRVGENSRRDRLLRERRACAQRYAHGCRGLALYLHRQHRHMDMGDMAHMAVMAIMVLLSSGRLTAPARVWAARELIRDRSGPAFAETRPRVPLR